MFSIIARCVVFAALGSSAGGCRAVERPVSPWRLEGFPGAAIEVEPFPLDPGTTWRFRDRLDPAAPPLELRLAGDAGALTLEGAREGGVTIARNGDFLEISKDGRVVDRPLRFSGRVGESWRSGDGQATAFGYDRLKLGGGDRRALVIGVDRRTAKGRERDLYWFVPAMGWVRLRTEREGRAIRDAFLVDPEPPEPPN